MGSYFRKRYSPGNLFLVGSGRVDFDRLVEQAEALCGEWEPQTPERDTSRAKPHVGFDLIYREQSNQQYVLQLCEAPSAQDEQRHAARLLSTIVGDDSGSRLYWELVDPGRAESANMSHGDYDGSGILMTWMNCDPAQAVENLERMHAVYSDLEARGITAEELAQAKSKLKSRVVLSGERPSRRLFSVGSDWMQRGEYRSVRDTLEEIEAVTVDQVNDLLARYPLSHNTTLTIGPLKKFPVPE